MHSSSRSLHFVFLAIAASVCILLFQACATNPFTPKKRTLVWKGKPVFAGRPWSNDEKRNKLKEELAKRSSHYYVWFQRTNPSIPAEVIASAGATPPPRPSPRPGKLSNETDGARGGIHVTQNMDFADEEQEKAFIEAVK